MLDGFQPHYVAMNLNGLQTVRFVPEELRLIWDEYFAKDRLGGLTSLRGLYYQYLYSLELGKELLKIDPLYDAYACEWIEDFVAWRPRVNGTLERILLVQVKTALRRCFLEIGNTRNVFSNLGKAIDRLSSCLNPGTKLKCRVVYNSIPGHDCASSGCEDRIRARPSYKTLADKACTLFPSDVVNQIEFVRFLPIPITREAILSEVQFLNDQQPGLINLLEAEKDLTTFVRSIYGLIAPLYIPQTQAVSVDQCPNELQLAGLHRDRVHTINDLNTALEIVASMKQRAIQGTRRQMHEFSKRRARTDIENAILTKQVFLRAEAKGITFEDKEEARNALSVIHALASEADSILFHVDHFALVKYNDRLRLELPSSEAVPISDYLKQSNPTHRERVRLLLSFIKALVAWAKKGVVLLDFRADSQQYEDLYLAKPGPCFILGDLGALALSTTTRRLLDEQWVPGPLLAKAFRYLYYGKISRRDIENTRLYRASWNDNAVRDLARWLDSVPFIDSTEAEDAVKFLFRDELEGWPLIFSGIDDQFIHDTVDLGYKLVADVLGNSRPSYLSKDPGHYQHPMLYTSWRDAQIGSFEDIPNSLTLYRYTEYETRRWASARESDRDRHKAVELDRKDRDHVLAVYCPQPDVKTVCSRVFGIAYEDYEEWLKDQKYRVSHIPVNVLPPILERERNLFRYRLEKLDALGDKRFAFSVINTKSKLDHSSNVLSLRVSNGTELIGRLNELGYRPKTIRSLSVACKNAAGRRLTAAVFEIRPKQGEALLDVILPRSTELPPDEGYLNFTDEGTRTVLKAEDAIFRQYDLFLSTSETIGPEIAVGRAWRWLEPLVGKDRPHVRSHRPNSNDGYVCKKNDEVIKNILQSILDVKGDSYWQVLTGAAGTGKTFVTASIAFQYLERTSTREFPARRVLVVSSAHFAIDNFVRVFLRVCGRRYMPYRFVTESRLLALKSAGVIDARLYDECQEYYGSISADLPHPPRPTQSLGSFVSYLENLKTHLHETNRGRAKKPSMFVPSHHRWRMTYTRLRKWATKQELNTRRLYLKTKRERLNLYEEHSRSELSSADFPMKESSLYALFASEVVATTVDAFDRLPDMSFDLIIFEEASQIGVLKLLKVLTKVARARDMHLPAPAIVLSGDQRQLPPFLEATQPDASYPGATTQILKKLGAEVRKEVGQHQDYETAFEMVCRRHSKRIYALTTQYRMQAEIATLVNTLFYGEQKWRTPQTRSGAGVVWIDTSALAPLSETEKGGTSRFNTTEIRVISNLVKNLLRDRQNQLDEILVISPYLAQVSKLEDTFKGNNCVKVRTIDGCQGIEADIVIVSFVSLSFSPGRDFVVNPKRMNVAVSRARDSLYLVGNFNEISGSVRRLKVCEEYYHITELLKIFGPKGLLGRKLMPAR